MTMRRTIPLQTTSVPFPQQAPSLAMQAGTVPASTAAAQLDISSLMNLMITMMIVVMMMKMMTGAMGSLA